MNAKKLDVKMCHVFCHGRHCNVVVTDCQVVDYVLILSVRRTYQHQLVFSVSIIEGSRTGLGQSERDIRSGERTAQIGVRSVERTAQIGVRSGERTAQIGVRSGERTAQIGVRSGERTAQIGVRSGERTAQIGVCWRSVSWVKGLRRRRQSVSFGLSW